MKLDQKIETLAGVGEKNAKRLKKLGIFNIQNLVHHFPFRYDDLSQISKIVDVRPGGRYTIKAKVTQKKLKRIFRRHISIFEILAQDDTGSIVITWFNQHYLDDIFQKDKTYLFAGEIKTRNALQMQNPVWELVKPETVHIGRVVPVYPLTAEIFPKWLRSLLKNALDSLPAFPEYLPPETVKVNNLLSYDQAIRSIHFPKNLQDANRARKRLAFEELLFYEFKILKHKKTLRKSKSPKVSFNEPLTKKFVSSLPFQLTDSQKKSSWQIIKDLEKNYPSNLLLTGDVGSGKTIVAAIACLQAVSSGYNVAIMVPTEILALQHYKTFCSFPIFKDFEISLLTGSKKINVGKGVNGDNGPKLFIGTHALIQKNTGIDDLGLVVIDEQHRFGVSQRAFLTAEKKSLTPHLLSMTATPIPRSFALTLYGDLDISRISEMPRGRKKIITKIVTQERRKAIYTEVEKQIIAGRQVFVVCPLIDPSDKLGVKSATEEKDRLEKEVFSKNKIGLLHGRLKAKDKEKVIKDFAEHKLDILVSTTVVEVGVNFPNATVMMIEAAESFGLAQLHQLRGRVGRSEHQSYCYLLPENLTQKAKQRLEALEQKHSGLELAEIDLQLRGPGDVYGKLQSGYLQFKLADIFDTELLESAKTAAEEIFKMDLEKYPVLKQKITAAAEAVHLE